ncbi:hypothetical protein [Halostreptopolyspora alba]|uniref:Uncharacterized protein n=1 Tax=Halostreptopolyspora alba TaxID=2487137 RepID=A0A3N0EHU3_9ACTN|nr:hypothetical protein EFW17_00515 [Nocardiopsaceae bacterium YIM 96095]
MRKAIQVLGLVVTAVGVSGTIDRLLGHQPIMGFLNVVNRLVIPRSDALTGYELFANLIVAFLGLAVLMIASASRSG